MLRDFHLDGTTEVPASDGGIRRINTFTPEAADDSQDADEVTAWF